jgi:hypothetical protein
MMKTTVSSFTILVFLLSFALTGCKQEEEPVEPEIPSLDFVTQVQAFQTSQGLSDYVGDPNAQLTYTYVSTMQGIFAAYASFLAVPATAAGDGNNIWTWGDGAGSTVTYQWTSNGGNNCVTISMAGPDIANGRYFEFCEKQDGTGGWMKIYDPENNNMLTAEAIWTLTGENAGTMEFIDYEFNDRQIITWNADGSGSLKVFEDTLLTYESTWNADGTGSFKEYDSQGGLIDSGSWG